MLRVGLIGCGRIADQHAAQIHRVAGAELVGVYDQEELMGRQLAERFAIPRVYSSLDAFLTDLKPDIVHITTPPQSHFTLGKACIEAGSHVYIEKPFTVSADEAIELLEAAENAGLKATAGHNVQFTPEMLGMRRAVQDGFLGGAPSHIESTFSYDLGDATYVRGLLGDSGHWVRQLPGQLLHNIISHGIAKIAEFISCERPSVCAHGFTSPTLLKAGEKNIVDELRVVITDRRHTTAYFTFSTQLVPPVQELRLFGPAGSVFVDNQHRTLLLHDRANSQYRSYLNFFVPPFRTAGQLLKNAGANVSRFARADFHADVGLKNLIEAFYRAVDGTGTLPIPYREIVLTSRIMDDIFCQLNERTG